MTFIVPAINISHLTTVLVCVVLSDKINSIKELLFVKFKQVIGLRFLLN